MKLSKRMRLFLSLTSLLICVCMCSLTVNADTLDVSNAETETSADDAVLYADGKISLSTAKSMVDSYAQQMSTIATLSVEELKYLDELYSYQTDFYGSFAKVAQDCGTFVGYENVEVEETDEEACVKIKADMKFSDKDIKMTLNVKCFDTIGQVVTSTEFGLADDTNLTISDKLASAGLNTVMGMGTVFIVLILISLIIYCFNFIPKIQAIFSKKDDEKEPIVVSEEKTVTTVAENKTDDLELIAVIAAAIAASENTTTDSFVVRSIRKR